MELPIHKYQISCDKLSLSVAGEVDSSFSQHPDRDDKPRTSGNRGEPKREIKAKEDVSSTGTCV